MSPALIDAAVLHVLQDAGDSGVLMCRLFVLVCQRLPLENGQSQAAMFTTVDIYQSCRRLLKNRLIGSEYMAGALGDRLFLMENYHG